MGVSIIKSICFLSIHGFFDYPPELGKPDTGGQVMYVIQLALALASNQINVDIYTRWFENTKPQIVNINSNVRIIRIPAGGWEFIPKESIYAILPEFTTNMIKYMNSNGLSYDIVHGHYVDAGIVSVDLAQYFQKPVFFTSHSLGAWKQQNLHGSTEELDLLFNFSHRIKKETSILHTINGYIATTVGEISKLQELYSYSGKNIIHIPPGIEISRFRPLGNGEKLDL